MSDRRFALFGTTLGTCGIAWSGRGICRVHLPEADADAVRWWLLRSCGTEAEPPETVRDAIQGIVALLDGEAVDLRFAELDLAGTSDFAVAVYRAARDVLPGSTATYGEIAARIGMPGEARAVGQALGRNPCPILVPCHRILAAGGRTGGFSADGGVVTKLKMLTIERARTGSGPTLFEGGDWPFAARRG